MPDNSIAYGLLLESGQQVNIYDWMSAFNSIVGNRNADDDDERDIPPEIQLVVTFFCLLSTFFPSFIFFFFFKAELKLFSKLMCLFSINSSCFSAKLFSFRAKFTRARAELHFMGYTKNSKRKTDHVTRTTW